MHPYTRAAIALLVSLASGMPAAAQPADSVSLPETNFYEITTPQGRMVVQLYNETPAHRDNFKRLVAEELYDSTLFHRVIRNFMIQGGDPLSKDADPLNDGMGDPGYTLPAEIRSYFFHRKGALAAAREGDQVNPERRSSGSQFYIVEGQPFDSLTLNEIEEHVRQVTQDPDFSFSQEAGATYGRLGGAPFLDGQYTIFGQLVEGYDVLEAIAAQPTPNAVGQPAHPAVGDRPVEPVPMTIRPLPGYLPPASVPR